MSYDVTKHRSVASSIDAVVDRFSTTAARRLRPNFYWSFTSLVHFWPPPIFNRGYAYGHPVWVGARSTSGSWEGNRISLASVKLAMNRRHAGLTIYREMSMHPALGIWRASLFIDVVM